MDELIKTEERMTSLQIAEVTGKEHAHVMRDIRRLLEQGVHQSNFGLMFRISKLGNGAERKDPYYSLTKKGCLILASGYDALLREKIINRWEELELREQNVPALDDFEKKLKTASFLASYLNLSDASKLLIAQAIAQPFGLPLPEYVSSKGVHHSASELLKKHGVGMSVVKFNEKLVEKGYLVEATRKGTSKLHKFKVISGKGLEYGENVVSPKNQNDTQPHWYDEKFEELVNIIK